MYIYVFINTCIHIYTDLHTFLHLHIWCDVSGMCETGVCTYMYLLIYVSIHILIYTHFYIYVYGVTCQECVRQMYVHIYISLHVLVYIYTHFDTRLYMYLYTYIRICIRVWTGLCERGVCTSIYIHTCTYIDWLMIAFITCNSNLVHLLEGLCNSNLCRFEFSIFWVFAGIEPTTSELTVPRSDQLS